MATFVLVPGFWLGGWAWRDVAVPLRAGGHTVYPVTLTGLGERVHLAAPTVNLDTHIADVVNLIRYEDLQHVILVGHSYAGVVITGVADRIPERIARLVYVDTAPLPDGVAQIEFNAPEDRSLQERQVAEHGDGWRLPMPAWGVLDKGNNLVGLGDAERALMQRRAVDQPFGTATQPLHLTNAASTPLPRTAIWCTLSTAQVRELVASSGPLFSALASDDWQFLELPTGHWPMFSRPHDLAELLLRLAA